jgi:hypothetical protein
MGHGAWGRMNKSDLFKSNLYRKLRLVQVLSYFARNILFKRSRSLSAVNVFDDKDRSDKIDGDLLFNLFATSSKRL